MTKERREEAIEFILGQLENGYLDLGMNDQEELEVVKEAVNTLRITDRWIDIPFMTTEWMKLGYTEETAKELAETSCIFQ